MPRRRRLLRGAAVLAAGGPLAYLAANRMASAATGLPLTIVNHTYRYPNAAIWMYIVGTDLASGRQAYVRADGTLVPVSASLNGADGFADLSIPLAADGDTTVTLPKMSGRVYFSITNKLKFKVVTDGAGNAALQYPAGWVASDPSYPVLHDWIEFTYNDAGMFCNTTAVDMFAIPLAISLVGASTQTTGTLASGGRGAIFSGIKALPDYARLVVGDLRVIAPGHGIDAGLFSSTYFDAYVTSVWNRYAGTNLTVTANGTTYTGRVSGGALAWSGGVATMARPTTRDIFYCAGALAAPNDGRTGPVAAAIGAAFNRGTLLSQASQPVTTASSFYTTSVANHYSRVIHQNMVDGKAYGFPFDDVANFASYVQDTAPKSITVSLTPF